ncbi:unnamed protein product [Porites evermanni]|uniref:Uncharacterized protein n=1 Tax=Porites evermanni TaxID=104178 RepID=A0ABN8LVE7_9CNID|nr:unnamed protein product [Porites evermanni]
MSKENRQVPGFESLYDVGDENFSLSKSLEAFHSASGQVLQRVRVDSESQDIMGRQRDQQQAAAGLSPSSSYRATLTRRSSWIREEDNREENTSSFNDLGEYSPQLANPTKTRIKRPGVRRPKRSESSAERQIPQKQFEKQGAQGTSSLSKEPPKRTYRAGAGTSLTIKDNTSRTPSNSCTKDKVNNLRARFEQMSG